MMLDQVQGRLWTAHGKAAGDELSAIMHIIAPRLQLARLLRAAQSLGSVLAAVVAGIATIGIAALPGLGRAAGLL